MVGGIQTFGQLIHFHPHIHALVTEGVFLPDGSFLPLPKLASEPFLKLWQQEVFALLLAEGKITEETVANIRSWKHSGFSVDQSVRLQAEDQEGVRRLIQYFLRCPFSQARMIEVTQDGKVIYKSEHNAVGRFPEPGEEEQGGDTAADLEKGRGLLKARVLRPLPSNPKPNHPFGRLSVEDSTWGGPRRPSPGRILIPRRH